MRLALVIALCCLTGCVTTRPPLPPQPEAPTSESVVTTVGKEWDKADQKVAAAVSIARENADKPEVVRGETTVALSYLPPASPEELALARQRAAKADQKDYAAAVAFGQKLLAKIDADWAKVEAAQKEALRVSQLKDKRIEELTADIERVKAEASKNIWTLLGAGLFAAGALTTAFLGARLGIPLLACAALAGSVPFIYDSPAFMWVAIRTAAIAAQRHPTDQPKPLYDSRGRWIMNNFWDIFAVAATLLIAFVLFEPMGIYGRWLKLRTFLQLFPFYRRGMFKRQKSFAKSERLR